MNRTELVKRAYAEGAFAALQELGYEKTAAAEIAMKMAGEDEGIGALGGAGLGALGGVGLGAGGAALASLLLKRNLMKDVPGLGRALKNTPAIQARLHAKGILPRTRGNILKFLAENPEAASAIGGGVGGAGLGALGGGLYGGLSD